jgi:import receptor subunit TOM22
MVKLEEVLDEEFTRTQNAPLDDENDWDTDSTGMPIPHCLPSLHPLSALRSPLSPLALLCTYLLTFRLQLTAFAPSDSDAESEISLAPDESLYERLAALQDIVPASARRKVTSTVSTTTSWVKSGLLFGGKTLWVVSTSALLLGVPWALAYSEEQNMVEMEREMKMQQSASEVG